MHESSLFSATGHQAWVMHEKWVGILESSSLISLLIFNPATKRQISYADLVVTVLRSICPKR
jgi:hypothetical protein